MSKFRASYSVLSLWDKKMYKEAIDAYFKLHHFDTPQMEQGRQLHKAWAAEVQVSGTVPSVFGGKGLQRPTLDKKIECSLSGQEDWLEIVGIPDLVDESTIYEFKSGVANSLTYARTYQAGLYALLLTKNGVFVDRAVFMHYNQYTKRADTSYVWLTDALLHKTINWVLTLASEMHDYLVTLKLYDQYDIVLELDQDDLEADVTEIDITLED